MRVLALFLLFWVFPVFSATTKSEAFETCKRELLGGLALKCPTSSPFRSYFDEVVYCEINGGDDIYYGGCMLIEPDCLYALSFGSFPKDSAIGFLLTSSPPFFSFDVGCSATHPVVPVNNGYCVVNPTPSINVYADKPYCHCVHPYYSSDTSLCGCLYDDDHCTPPDAPPEIEGPTPECSQHNINGVISFCRGLADCGYTTSSCTTKEPINPEDDACMAEVNTNWEYDCLDTTADCGNTKNNIFPGSCIKLCSIAGRDFYYWKYNNETKDVLTCQKEEEDTSIPDCPAGQHWETMGTQETSHCVPNTDAGDGGDGTDDTGNGDDDTGNGDDGTDDGEDGTDNGEDGTDDSSNTPGSCDASMKNCDWGTTNQGEHVLGDLTRADLNDGLQVMDLKELAQNEKNIATAVQKSDTHLKDIQEQLMQQGVKADDIQQILSQLASKDDNTAYEYHQLNRQHNTLDASNAQAERTAINDIASQLNEGVKTNDGVTTEAMQAVGQSMNGVKEASNDLASGFEGLGTVTAGLNGSVQGLNTSMNGVNGAVGGLKGSVDGVGSAVDGLGDKLDGIIGKLGGGSDGVGSSPAAGNPYEGLANSASQELTGVLNSMKGQATSFSGGLGGVVPNQCGLLPVLSVSIGSEVIDFDFTQQGYCNIMSFIASVVIGLSVISSLFIVMRVK